MPTKNIIWPFLALFLTALSTTPDVAKNEVTENRSIEEEIKSDVVHIADWSYEGETGPGNWSSLHPDYEVCTNGKEQSPINIETSNVIEDKNIGDMDINYQPTLFSLSNNGHTIQANPLSFENTLVLDDKEYKLKQFHFHTPSEHQLNGENFDIEIQCVQADEKYPLSGLGLFFREGASNPYLEKAWQVIPSEETTEDIQLTEPIDLMDLLPDDKDSFHYMGSLTTPPCSEEVQWIVLKESIDMSKGQIDKFRHIFSDNHRPVQPLYERKIKKVED